MNKENTKVTGRVDFRLSPWNEYCFLVLGVLHGVRGEFTDDVSKNAVGSVFTSDS